ncbi:TPA: DUF551 domain-containing protein [Enterobacter roggenkampii]
MSTITKQWLKQKISEMEATRDEIPFGLDEDDSNTLAALRIALASLEANGAIANEGTITATQFKPVADLYEVTVPSGRSTTFTKDAAEASDCRVMGWSVQEYVKLERYQAAMLQNGNSPAQSDCCPAQNYIAPTQDGDSPVLPDGWVACSERMPENDDFVYIWPRKDFGVELHVAQCGKFDKRDTGWYAQVYEQNYGIEYHPITVTHWQPLPAAPQQEELL